MLVSTFLILIFIVMVAANIVADYLIKWQDKRVQDKTQDKAQDNRTHNNIKPSNYESVFNTRASYDEYKGRNGLYEPQKPKRGIELKQKED